MTKHPIKTIFRQRTNFRMILPFAVLFIATTGIYAQTTNPKKISESDEVFTMVDKIPEFMGGDEGRISYINKKLVYPVEAQKKGIQGRVIVNFIVEKDGSISSPQIVRGVDSLLDKTTIDLISGMPKWIPGELNNEIVRVKFTLPIVFRLQGMEKEKILKDSVSNSMDMELITIVEKQPEFPGGDEARNAYLTNNLRYPADAEAEKIEGRVICNFIVERDGSISEVNVVKGVHPSLDKEAIRLIQNMPKWIPATQRGKAVKMRFTLPVFFKVEKKEKNDTFKKISESDEIYTEVDKQPEFPGGEKARREYLNEKTSPPKGVNSDVQGRVFVNFVVEKDGSITNVQIERGVEPAMDKHAVKIVENMPRWIPGERNGEIVRVRYTLPIQFRLQQ